MRRASRSVAWVLGLCGLLGCPEGPPVQSALELEAPEAGDAVPLPTNPTTPEPSAMAERMHERFERVSQIQRATIRGDVEAARTQAAALRELLGQEPPPPRDWEAEVTSLRGELEALGHADDLREASSAVARIGSACGRCHRTQMVSPPLPTEPPPAVGESFEAAMAVHRWAADRMWEGLVGPAGDRWIQGSDMFVVIPGCDQTMAGGTEADRLTCQHAQSLARRGHVTESLEARATVYGRLLATCAECHQRAAARAQAR